jgi:endonuclease/exonuclease/phosphatase (EEP) superfamily protein YafD
MLSKAEFRGGLLALCGILVLAMIIIIRPGLLPGGLLLQSLRFHILLAGLALALLTMLVGARWRGGVVLVLVLASIGYSASFAWEYYARRTALPGEPVAQLDFLSFNVLYGNQRTEELLDALLADPPQLALIMETPEIEPYLDRMASVFPYRIGCDVADTCDIALFSTLPFESGAVQTLSPFGHERLVVASLMVDGQKLNVAGVHLSKPYFDRASYEELYQIHEALKDLDGPLLLAGDFNSAFWTEPMMRLGEALELVPGPWPAATWPVRLGPLGVPIDNVFTRGTARLLTLEAGDSIGSNHRPLRAQVAIYPEP